MTPANSARLSKTILFVVGLCGLGLAFLWLSAAMAHRSQAKSVVPQPDSFSVRLVPGHNDMLEFSPEVIKSLGIRTYEVKQARSQETLRFSGSLFLDSNRMVRVHSRFPGEVVSIGSVKEGVDPAADPEGGRPLRLRDKVKKGQLLAIIWSKEVGEKKSDLVNAWSQYYLDKAQLDRLKKLGGVVPDRSIREKEREVEHDIIARDQYERTLRSWRLTEKEIDEVRSEAERIHNNNEGRDMALEKSWAEVDVRAPFDGEVLERNITTGDIVDTSLDLFKIADLSRLGVLANVYEEDLPTLESLAPEDRRWTIQLKAQPNAPSIQGSFDLIGNIIDPNQHTAIIMGWIDNPGGRLLAGQFITALVELPSTMEEVAIPETALLDQGSRSIVFVAPDMNAHRVTQRVVAVSRRGQDMVFIRSQPTEAERQAGCRPLMPGEYVVTAGTVELAGALDDMLATAAPGEKPQK